MLTFLVVISPEAARGMASVTLQRSDLARSTATAAPGTIRSWQVLEHGLRHLAWLAHEDEAVSSALSPAWHRTLTGYVPAPFQQLG